MKEGDADMKNPRLALVGLAMLFSIACGPQAFAGSISKVNGSVHVSAGDSAQDVSTVNGSIRIDDGATTRDLSTVNGSITLGRDATADKIGTVNGGISLATGAKAAALESTNGKLSLDEGARVAEKIDTVNGSIKLERNADVAGKVSNVNGSMALRAAHVGGGLETVNGDLDVGADSRVEGGILVKKPSGTSFSLTHHVPEVVIGPGAVVNGTLRFEREVRLFVSDRATVGHIEGATPVRFSGDQPGSEERRKAEQLVEK
jgi:DUF4097 and DUF4098 domain-containing protein YvlB